MGGNDMTFINHSPNELRPPNGRHPKHEKGSFDIQLL
jgi:hypothetical protein